MLLEEVLPSGQRSCATSTVAGGQVGSQESRGVLTHGPVAQSIPQQRAVWPCAGVMGKRGSCLDFGFSVSLSER